LTKLAFVVALHDKRHLLWTYFTFGSSCSQPFVAKEMAKLMRIFHGNTEKRQMAISPL
jgi:hypothetical protein